MKTNVYYQIKYLVDILFLVWGFGVNNFSRGNYFQGGMEFGQAAGTVLQLLEFFDFVPDYLI